LSSFAGLPLEGRAGAVVLGAEDLRTASEGLRPWHPTLGFDVLKDAVDGGSGPVEPWLEAGAVPITVGGGTLRALRARHGPLALLTLDAHAEADRLAELIRDDLVDPDRSLVAGVRGPLPESEELTAVRERGVDVLTGDELRAQGPGEYSQRVLSRAQGVPCVLVLDLDVIDPAFAPAVATPEVAGLLPHEAITLLRSLAGTAFVGFELTGLAPEREGPAQTASVLAANLVWEMLALRVLSAHE
jgi:arginase family enzyme